MKQSLHVPIIRIVQQINDLIMSSKLLSKLLCKNNKANSTRTWGRSTTATAEKKGYLVVSGLHDNFDKLPKKNCRTGNFIWSGAVIFIIIFSFLLIKRQGYRSWHRVSQVSGNMGIFFFFYALSLSEGWGASCPACKKYEHYFSQRSLHLTFSLVILVWGVGGKLSRLVYLAPCPGFGSVSVISRFLLHHNLGIFSCKGCEYYFSQTEMFSSKV